MVKDGGAAALRGKFFVSNLERGVLIGRGEVGGDEEMAEETRIQDELRLRGGKVGGVRGAGEVAGARVGEVVGARAGESAGGGGEMGGASSWVDLLSNLKDDF